MAETVSLPHKLTLTERKNMVMTGVTEVISFDENAVVLATTSGNMSIEGSELKVNILDVKEGSVSVDGHIDCVYYFDPTSKQITRGWFGRLFH